jgi:hypothetical protein
VYNMNRLSTVKKENVIVWINSSNFIARERNWFDDENEV